MADKNKAKTNESKPSKVKASELPPKGSAEYKAMVLRGEIKGG